MGGSEIIKSLAHKSNNIKAENGIQQAEVTSENLRKEWSDTPVKNFEKRNQLKQQGKTVADRIKKMEKGFYILN
jgi:hypothetical protein